MPNPEKESERFRNTYVLVVTLAISLLFLAMIWPYLKTLLVAAITAGLLHPVYRFFVRAFRGRETLASITTILVLIILVLCPLKVFLGIVANQAIALSETAIPWVKEQIGDEGNMPAFEKWIADHFPALSDMIPTRSQLLEWLADLAQNIGSFLAAAVSGMAAGAATFFLHLFIMLYALFFFLISGRALLEKIFSYSPLPQHEKEQLAARFLSVTRATLKGTVVIGVIQGALGGMGFAVAGIPNAALWGALMAVLSVIPSFGTALVWVPAVAFLFFNGDYQTAILLLVWCAGVVGTVDNLLRPKLVGRDAKMPDLLILLGTLGGLYLFGGVGLIIGPIICSIFLSVLEIYRATFKDFLQPVDQIAKNSEKG